MIDYTPELEIATTDTIGITASLSGTNYNVTISITGVTGTVPTTFANTDLNLSTIRVESSSGGTLTNNCGNYFGPVCTFSLIEIT